MIIFELLLQMNYSDLSPNYSGFLMSIGNTVASTPGFVAPLLTGIITEDNVSWNLLKFLNICDRSLFQSTIAAWRTIFTIAAGFYVIPSIIFVIFGKAKVQPFDDYANNDEKLIDPNSVKQKI